jgi:heme-degrading monooxygenase HmoA
LVGPRSPVSRTGGVRSERPTGVRLPFGKGSEMPDSFENWASGQWKVMEGKEDEFVARRKAWLEWSSQNIPGMVWATLVRDNQDPRRFVSFSAWKDEASREAWKNSSGFSEMIPAAKQVCDEFHGGDHQLVVTFFGSA